MKNKTKYLKLTREWNNYIENLMDKFIKKFASTKSMRVSAVAKFLSDNDWTTTLQTYTWESAVLGGNELGFDDFTHSLLTFKTYDGKTIDAWKNSRVVPIARRMIQSLKPNLRIYEQRQAILEGGAFDDIVKLSIMVDSSSGRQQARKYISNPSAKNKDTLTRSIGVAINEGATKAVANTFEHTNSYQGRRISQDQLQRAVGDAIVKQSEEVNDEDDLVLEGIWTLSLSHPKGHMKNDPCEKFAKQKYFYSDEETIPIPHKSTHYGCKCSCKTRVIKKSEKHK